MATHQTEYLTGKEFCKKMVTFPSTTKPDPKTQRREIPSWVNPDEIPRFHAFCVAYDILGTSYRPLECRLWNDS